MKQKQIELYRRDDGFYAARQLKDGSLSADAHKVTAEEIMTMFTEFFGDYCRETGQTKLLMQDAEGRLFATMRVQPKANGAPKPQKPQKSHKAPKPHGTTKPHK